MTAGSDPHIMIPPALKKSILIYSGANALRRRLNRRPRILFWHGIDNEVNAVVGPENFDVRVFRQQVAFLSRHYDVIAIDEFERRLTADAFNGREMLLTFDDGYANNLSVVEPILSGYGMPFTIFVSTDNITSGDYYPTTVNRLVTIAAGLDKLRLPSIDKEFDMPTEGDRIATARDISRLLKSSPLDVVKGVVKDLIDNLPVDEWENLKNRFNSLRPLNWEELALLAQKDNVTIGSHGLWHICCHERQREEDVREQIEKSRQIIEERLQVPCEYFAYPNGNYTGFSNQCVKENYKLGFSAETKTRVSMEHRYILPRIPGYLDLKLFKILLSS